MRQQKSKTISRRVGLDIGSHTIKGVEVVERGPEMVVRSVGSAPIHGGKGKSDPSDQGPLIHAIKALWSAARFESTSVVVALPPESVYVKWLHLEAPDRETLDQTARTAATRGAPFPPESAIVDYRVLSSRGTVSPSVHFVMLVAASASAVDSLLNTVESAGLEPAAVDIEVSAPLRSFDSQKRSGSPLWSGQPLAHCVLGAASTTITVVRGGEMEFARTVPVGGNDFTECIAGYLGVSWAEAERAKTLPGSRLIDSGTLITSHDSEEVRVPCENVVGRLAREIQRSMRFFTSQFAEGSYLGMIGAATMSGGGALLKGLDACLQVQDIEITGIINPFMGLSVEAEAGLQRVGDTSTQYSTAVGLAIGDYRSTETVVTAEISAAA